MTFRSKRGLLDFRQPAPSRPVSLVLSAWLKRHRVPEGEAMKWLHEHHPALVKGCVLPRDLTWSNATKAVQALTALRKSRRLT